MEKLENTIGYTFKNKNLAVEALTHTSYANEVKRNVQHNERLEFLGDSVLSVVVSEYIFEAHKDLPEGELSRLRASLVCEKSLYTFAKSIQLGEAINLGNGEEKSGGRDRAAILADAFEALIAAIYLDGGLEDAKRFILPFIKNAVIVSVDYKTKLQEIIQQNKEERLSYQVIEETGPDHNKSFTVQVLLNSNVIGTGKGHSKKEAEQQSAKEALCLMGVN